MVRKAGLKSDGDLRSYLRCKRYLSRRYQHGLGAYAEVLRGTTRYFLLSGVATDRDRLGATRGYWPFA